MAHNPEKAKLRILGKSNFATSLLPLMPGFQKGQNQERPRDIE